MKTAIMQPYLFPYIGYFQLIHAVEIFVVYDDVNFIKSGWINRNNILGGRGEQLITLQLEGASQNKLINEINIGKNVDKILQTCKHNYSKAPFFNDVFPLIEKILLHDEINLSKFIQYSLLEISEFLGMDVKFIVSSEINKDTNLRGQEKILEVCKAVGATEYINLPGGRGLYEKQIFKLNNIGLSFIEPNLVRYKQFIGDFVPGLSIIDVMMFNDKNKLNNLIQEYRIDR
jgi:hypothetical protein